MASQFNIEVVTPDKQFFHGETDMCILRTTEGDIGVLKGHIPTVALLAIGTIRIRQNNEFKIATCSGGFVNIESDNVVVVTDCAEWADEIDLERAKVACERAKQRINNHSSDIDLVRAELALKKALNRIHVATNK